jgi:hypothetical protein
MKHQKPMLDTKETLNPNGWETHFCVPMAAVTPIPLTGGQAKMLLQLHIAGDGFTFPEGDRPFALKMLDARLPMYGIKMTDAAKLFIAGLASTPAQISMFLTYVAWRLAVTGGTLANIEFLCVDAFPAGIPSEADLKTLWDIQKVSGTPDNLLDHPTAGASITEKFR